MGLSEIPQGVYFMGKTMVSCLSFSQWNEENHGHVHSNPIWNVNTGCQDRGSQVVMSSNKLLPQWSSPGFFSWLHECWQSDVLLLTAGIFKPSNADLISLIYRGKKNVTLHCPAPFGPAWPRLLRQRIDDISQCWERQVDLGTCRGCSLSLHASLWDCFCSRPL